ncbi:MAG: adenylate cyclase [Thermoleophilaceae bacterium]|nr:adenylate cyclase [Thermoleophilaceae bacterium]
MPGAGWVASETLLSFHVPMTDWAAEGLLDGLDSDAERHARLELLDRLEADGCGIDELRRAVDEDRLSLMPVQRLLLKDRRYTKEEAAELTGLSIEYLDRDHLAMGLTFARGELAYTEDNIHALRALKQMMDAGVTEREVLMLTRMVGQASGRLAEAVLATLGRVLLQPGVSERDLGLQLADTAAALLPSLGPMLQGPFEVHIADLVQREAIGRVERELGRLPGGRPVAVCFADMVGFTSLAEELDIDRLGAVTERFGDLAGETAQAPVRLVKLIGDAAMFVSDDAAALVEASLRLIDAAASDDLLPQLRAGAAAGPALRREGDVYGRPVNLAARITAAAPAGGLVADGGLRDATRDTLAWAPAGSRGFKGIEGEVALYRLER